MSVIINKSEESKFKAGHLCVAVVGDEVMVCEKYTKGIIKVYSKELEYVREIMSPDQKTGAFTSISSDEHGNVYVSPSDPANCRIMVFDIKWRSVPTLI